MKLNKYKGNPILVANEKNHWESLCVLNPAVWYESSTDTFSMLYRAAGKDKEHYIYIGLAESKDGFTFQRKYDYPILSPDIDNADGGGVEDPRIVKMGDWYYLTYASRPYAPGRYWLSEPQPWIDPPNEGLDYLKENHTSTHLAVSRDLTNFKKLGRISDSRFDDRDVIIFPQKINGQYVRLSRPMQWCGEGFENKNPAIWISFSGNLMEWNKPSLLMQGEQWWEDAKIGGSCPPIKTDAGWLHLYHGVASKDKAYRVGAVLLDLDRPDKIIARTKDFIMEPEFPHETDGYYNGCVFPTGNVVKDGILYVYYGAADKAICVATTPLSELLDYLIKHCPV
ncbi:MAG: glycosidase [Bacillota bacterium]|nr:glycosidase [Bacillota bacterium]